MKITVNKAFTIKYQLTENTKRVINSFGISQEKTHVIFDNFTLEFNKGAIVFIVGFSGSGKSVLMKELYKHTGGIYIYDWRNMPFDDRPIIDYFPKMDYNDKIYLLSKFGLGEVWKWVSPYSVLSDGEKYRFVLYYSFIEALNSGNKFLYIDEFCATLDRLTAKAIANNLHKMVKRHGITLVAATTHDDLIPYLKPDVLVYKEFDKNVRVEHAPVASED